jgi:Tfp pilus assembly protein PilW
VGFSLVEMLVAVMFIGILMAGMANVFKSSVSTMATAGEEISSARRNRMAMDLLYDDLNTAGMYLTSLSAPPVLDPANPAFYIIPNVAITGAAGDDPASADQLFFYLDDPLPFEGTLDSTGSGGNAARNAGQLVLAGSAAAASDNTFTIDCGNDSYANQVKAGTAIIFKDAWETYPIQGPPTVSGQKVTIQLGTSPNASVTGTGSAGTAPKAQHILNSRVMFYKPAQMVRYSIQMELYDPQKATGIPCLVRDQGTYSIGTFTPDLAQRSVVAENVSGFKAYLSANSGQSWAGYDLPSTTTGFADGWTNGIISELNTQLATAGRPDYTTTANDPNWIRDIPVLVRLDVKTRTAMKRSEYSTTPLTTTAYKEFTQSLVIVPRHFGLTMN